MKFKDWFTECLHVGPFPILKTGDSVDFNGYDMILNVSDEFYPEIDCRLRLEFSCLTHWFPMNEVGHDNGINSIYGACYVLRLAEEKEMYTYLHCHQGKHRSRVIQAAYHFMRSNSHYTGMPYNGWDSALHYDCAKGYLPPLDEMESFLGKLSHFKGRLSLGTVGGTLEHSKFESIKAYKLPSEVSRRK